MLFKILAVEVNYKMKPNMFSTRPRQLFITQSRVLAGRIKEFYDNLSRPFRSNDEKHSLDVDELVEDDDSPTRIHGDAVFLSGDSACLPTDLPNKISQLEDRHFPLFLSYDQVWQHILNLIL